PAVFIRCPARMKNGTAISGKLLMPLTMLCSTVMDGMPFSMMKTRDDMPRATATGTPINSITNSRTKSRTSSIASSLGRGVGEDVGLDVGDDLFACLAEPAHQPDGGVDGHRGKADGDRPVDQASGHLDRDHVLARPLRQLDRD